MEHTVTREKPVILAFNKFYLPGYRAGGPIRTLANMVERLGNDFDFFIITLDRDAGDKKCYESVPSEQWITVSNAQVMYLHLTKFQLIVYKKLLPSFRRIRYTSTVFLTPFSHSAYCGGAVWVGWGKFL